VRVVVDTNVLVSFLINDESVPGQAVTRIIENHMPLVSAETLRELLGVLARPRLQRYLQASKVSRSMDRYIRVAEKVLVMSRIDVCRDADDNRMLELAVDGRADLILTGDDDLLALVSFRSVEIMTPRRFLDEIGAP
jgi:uncharacterized protein